MEAGHRLETRGWLAAAAVLGLVSVLRGIQFPNLWSATQALLNYDNGLTRRGLTGATFGQWFHLGHYSHFVLFSCVWMLICLGMLMAVALKTRRVGHGQVAAVAFGSFAMTFLGCMIGYTDVLLLCLTCGLLLIDDTRWRAAVALPVCVTGVLLHELFLVVFLPVILLTFVRDVAMRRAGAGFALGSAGVIATCCLALAMGLTARGKMTMAEATEYRNHLAGRANFVIEDEVFRVLTRSVVENRRLMTDVMYKTSWYFGTLGRNINIMGPTLVLLLVTIVLVLRGSPDVLYRDWVLAASLLAGLAPLAMQFVAWDTGRFLALPVLTSFLVVVVLSPAKDRPAVRLPRWYSYAAVLVIGLAMLRSSSLIEGEAPNAYPFTEKARLLTNYMHSGHWHSNWQ